MASQPHGANVNETRGALLSGEQESAPRPRLVWELGTAYDLFLSLDVLHNPAHFGLRASWAAGVRSRLSTEERKILEEAGKVIHVPYHWIYNLPEPKDGAAVLWALRQLPAEERLPQLALLPRFSQQARQAFLDIRARGSWNESDVDRIKRYFQGDEKGQALIKNLEAILSLWAEAAAFGERYLAALQSYYQAFFVEEERHIAPILKDAQEQAQELAEQLPLNELLEQLSQGVHAPHLLEASELALSPSYWITPLVVAEKMDANRSIMIFGARPASESLVPGEVVPDALLRMLKAIADPTRLRILRYLAHEQLTPSEISRNLRLRAPTVTHHLNTLRLAGLVHLTLDVATERRYAARLEAVQGMLDLLDQFLQAEDEV
ncbi:MAG: winged helix-turn-helix transcriptional regulator [Anaerolineales bacterium]|nr:winged helix-turn-helix transcriptional regulator [Anaerolineales bacterium]